MKFYPHALPYEKYEDFVKICPINEYRVIEPTILPNGLPTKLLYKCNNAVLMASGSQLHHVVFVANLSRVETKALDQNPYIIWFDHERHVTTGGFIHHGDWEGRTIALESSFLAAIESSGIMAHYPYSEIPATLAGKLSDLTINSHNKAFWNAVRAIGK